MPRADNALPTPHHRLLNTPGVLRSLAVLLEGQEYAEDLRASPWDFAAELEAVLRAGGGGHPPAWLGRRGYAGPPPPDGGPAPTPRRAGGPAGVRFPKGTCFVLTAAGARAARALAAAAHLAPEQAALPTADGGPQVPVWDAELGVLRYRGQVV